jgi:predicted Rossmann fold nucleotide-binding protein DprA/Smf involved in DNA uptake
MGHVSFRIGDEQERLVTASPVMIKNRAPAGGNNYLENGLVKPGETAET